jgi:hypothetical protein
LAYDIEEWAIRYEHSIPFIEDHFNIHSHG